MTAERHVYTFGEYRLDTAERLLLRAGEPVPLAPKAFDMLVVLVKHSGHLLSKDQLMQEVWPDTFVEEVNLSVNISALRKVLGQGESGVNFIDTVARRGYRFTAPVTELDDDAGLVVHNRIRARIASSEVEMPVALPVVAATASLLTTNRRGRYIVTVVAPVAAAMLALGLVYRYYTHRSNDAVATPAPVNSIAVLPFRSLSPADDF